MNNKKYVPYSLAVKLKNVGYSGECNAYYKEINESPYLMVNDVFVRKENYNDFDYKIVSAPPLTDLFVVDYIMEHGKSELIDYHFSNDGKVLTLNERVII